MHISNGAEDKNISNQKAEEIYERLFKEQQILIDSKRSRTNNKWTKDELDILQWAVANRESSKGITMKCFTNIDWESIANLVPGRNGPQCKNKLSKSDEKANKKVPWTDYEDEILKGIIMPYGDEKIHWKIISHEFNETSIIAVERTGKQCRERWLNHLKEGIKKEPWSAEEDKKL